MKNKKIFLILAIVILVIITGGCIGYFTYLKPHNAAIKNYNVAVEVVNGKNAELAGEIQKLQALIDSSDKPLDETLIDTSKEMIKTSESQKVVVNKMPSKTDDIIAETEKISNPIDYSEITAKLKETYTALGTSQKQYKQFIKPSGEFVLQRISTIDEVAIAAPVTEDNDPNGNLNKPGGYTAIIYFESKNVDQSEVFGDDVIDKGTSAGGAIEVYANEDDANTRNEYLAGFDESILSSGSHKVVGTVVIRTSSKLGASKQKALEEKIIATLAKLD